MLKGWFVLGIVLLAGCATTNKNQSLQIAQLQSRVEYLEGELTEKQREIADLEDELQRKEEEAGFPKQASVKRKREAPYTTRPSIIQIQKALKNAGFYKGSIDGKIGTKTEEAIMKFQKENGLKADGKVGQITWSELKFYLNE